MPIDVRDLRSTIIPKSDQLNADQLLGGSITITLTDVQVSNSPDQPVTLHYAGDQGRPFKPCKTMRKLLIFAWGQDGSQWIGRSATLYNDPHVKFGGDQVGGIRISHLSHITKPVEASLAATRGKKVMYRVEPLPLARDEDMQAISGADTADALQTVFAAAWKATKGDAARAQLKAAYDARMTALRPAEQAQ
jgi:hypothetical protein